MSRISSRLVPVSLAVIALAVGTALIPNDGTEAAPAYVLDHFKCYVPDTANGVIDIPDENITVGDQFGSGNVTAENIQLFCNPTAKVHDGATTRVRDRNAHLTWYMTTLATDVTRSVSIRNQFGDQTITLPSNIRVRLGVPTKKNKHRFPAELDHYLCYVADGASPLNIRAGLKDEFFAEDVNLVTISLFCNPARKIHGTREFGVQHPDDHLACYFFNPTTGFSTGITILNQFNTTPTDIRVTLGQYLCVPTEKIQWSVVPPPT